MIEDPPSSRAVAPRRAGPTNWAARRNRLLSPEGHGYGAPVSRAGSLILLAGLLVAGVGLLPAAPAAAADPTTLTIAADADVEVRQDSPAANYGTRVTMGVDASPVRQAFVRFPLTGTAGREITRVRLRMYQVDASRTGGTVLRVPSADWTEAITWNTKPAMEGAGLATFGAVAAATAYELDLPLSSVTGDGSISFGLTSTSSDGADWATRESANPPTLIIDLAPAVPTGPAGPAPAVLTQVAGPSEASSSPTYYASNHRLGRTAAGRLLTVHGRHATGVQLAWRDPGSSTWSRATTGSVTDGLVLSGTGTGDWPASLAVGRGADGREFAVVTWSKPNFGSVGPVAIRVLTALDAPTGPQVGGIITLSTPPLGAARADVGIELAPDGTASVLLTWSERTAPNTYALRSAWLDNPTGPAPALTAPAMLFQDTSASRTATVASTPAGVRVAARADGGRLRVFGHDPSAPRDQWWSTGAGVALPTGAYPSAAGLPSGDVLVTAQRDTAQAIVAVQRFGGPGTVPATVLEMAGYADPAVASDASGAWLVAVRLSDGLVVSRSASPSGVWSTADQIELGAEGGGGHAWPSVLGGAKRELVVRGPGSSSTRSSVLAAER